MIQIETRVHRKSVFSRVACPYCKKIVDYALDAMSADPLNDHATQDVVCNECLSIIACFYEPNAVD
jgi:hypothetical protein